jgi:hypothetical protein
MRKRVVFSIPHPDFRQSKRSIEVTAQLWSRSGAASSHPEKPLKLTVTA